MAMAEEKVSLHIDDDWKKQAQEEKRRLAEEAAAKPPSPLSPAAGAAVEESNAEGAASAAGRSRGQMPQASFAALIQSLLTQVLFYLGDLAARGAEPTVNLDMAKHQIDTLGVLEEKTRGNLSDEEQRLMDTVLYEARMRYVSVASQYT
jgi:Domain of unknown function (DUF1844)